MIRLKTSFSNWKKKINAVKDNPVFQKNAHQLLADMSKEHGEFIFALRRVVNALDREGQMIPKEAGHVGDSPIPPEETDEEEPKNDKSK
jgi:hypothetical protein